MADTVGTMTIKVAAEVHIIIAIGDKPIVHPAENVVATASGNVLHLEDLPAAAAAMNAALEPFIVKDPPPDTDKLLRVPCLKASIWRQTHGPHQWSADGGGPVYCIGYTRPPENR